MPTTYNDQAYAVDIANVTVGDPMTVISTVIVDVNDDGLIDTSDTIDGLAVTAVWNGDTITVDGVLITGATVNLSDGSSRFLALDGSILANGTTDATTIVNTSTNFPASQLFPICFTRGTHILTEYGERRIETLQTGDLVETLDHGLQPIRWIGRTTAVGLGKFAPVRIRKGALGNSRNLTVSQQHRILLRGGTVRNYLGHPECLTAAKHLTDIEGVDIIDRAQVDYYHILFDQHQIVMADNLWCESLHPGDQTMASSKETRDELIALFPELADIDICRQRPTVRPVIPGQDARALPNRGPELCLATQ